MPSMKAEKDKRPKSDSVVMWCSVGFRTADTPGHREGYPDAAGAFLPIERLRTLRGLYAWGLRWIQVDRILSQWR